MHPRAKLTLAGRRLLIERVRDQGWTVATAAEPRVARAPPPQVAPSLRRRGSCRAARSFQPAAPEPETAQPLAGAGGPGIPAGNP